MLVLPPEAPMVVLDEAGALREAEFPTVAFGVAASLDFGEDDPVPEAAP